MSDVVAHERLNSGQMDRLSELEEAAGRVEDFFLSARLGTRLQCLDNVKQAL